MFTISCYKLNFWMPVLLLACGLPLFGATVTVTNLNDSGAGSLRDAIANAASGDAIQFSNAVTGTITLTTGVLSITKNLTIAGPGASFLAISGNNASQVFTISPGNIVSISGVKIESGANAGGAGGGIVNSGTLTLSNSTVSGNSSGSFSGGIDNDGGLTLINSTVSGNSAGSFGGAISNIGTLTLTSSTVSGNSANASGGGIANLAGTLTLTNSTLSGNVAGGAGGGIYNGGSLTLINSTLSGNVVGRGTGVSIFNQGTLTIKNTLLAHGNSGANCAAFGGSFTSAGHNLSDDNSCSLSGPGDITNQAAGLSPAGLANNGGPTQTIALLPGSAAVDAIPLGPVNYCTATDGVTPIATDQRGVTRPEGPACDIGAFELVGSASTTTTAANVTAIFNLNPQNVTLTATITNVAGTVNSGTVTFTVLGSSVTSGTVANGVASAVFQLPGNTPVGSYTITATYAGAGFATSSDSTHTLTVTPAAAVPMMSPPALAGFALLLAGLGSLLLVGRAHATGIGA